MKKEEQHCVILWIKGKWWDELKVGMVNEEIIKKAKQNRKGMKKDMQAGLGYVILYF